MISASTEATINVLMPKSPQITPTTLPKQNDTTPEKKKTPRTLGLRRLFSPGNKHKQNYVNPMPKVSEQELISNKAEEKEKEEEEKKKNN